MANLRARGPGPRRATRRASWRLGCRARCSVGITRKSPQLSVASTPGSWGSIRISTAAGAELLRTTEPSAADPQVNEAASPLLTTVQAADYLQVSTRTVKSLLSEGRIAYVKVGRTTRIHLKDLDHFIAQNRQKHRSRLRGRR